MQIKILNPFLPLEHRHRRHQEVSSAFFFCFLSKQQRKVFFFGESQFIHGLLCLERLIYCFILPRLWLLAKALNESKDIIPFFFANVFFYIHFDEPTEYILKGTEMIKSDSDLHHKCFSATVFFRFSQPVRNIIADIFSYILFFVVEILMNSHRAESTKPNRI